MDCISKDNYYEILNDIETMLHDVRAFGDVDSMTDTEFEKWTQAANIALESISDMRCLGVLPNCKNVDDAKQYWNIAKEYFNIAKGYIEILNERDFAETFHDLQHTEYFVLFHRINTAMSKAFGYAMRVKQYCADNNVQNLLVANDID